MRNNSLTYYRVGGLTFCFDAPELGEDEKLSLFRTDPAAADVTCRVRFSPELTAPEGQWLNRTLLEGFCRTEGGVARVLFRETGEGLLMTDLPRAWGREVTIHQSQAEYWGTNLALRALDLPRRVIPLGGVFLHASFIETAEGAILFTAPAQTGKSTQAELRRRYRGAEIINGDRALLRKNGDTWYAWGSPYCGTSKLSKNRALPIRAVVILEQALVSTAAPASSRQALRALLKGCSYDVWAPEQVSAVTALCGDLIRAVPFFTLSCLPDESAVTALEEVL